jgi:hypothetical protein
MGLSATGVMPIDHSTSHRDSDTPLAPVSIT